MELPSKNTYEAPPSKGWLLLAGAAAFMLVLFVKLFLTLSPKLKTAATALQNGRAIKLEAALNKDTLGKIIAEGNYFSDNRDIDLLVDSLSLRLLTAGAPDNLGAVNKNAFSIKAPLEWKAGIGGIDFQGRLEASRQRLGF